MNHRHRQMRRRRRQAAPRARSHSPLASVATVLVIGVLSARRLRAGGGRHGARPGRAARRRQGRGLGGLRRRRHPPRLRAVGHRPHVSCLSRDMPAAVRQATVAIEDERFYKHQGVDYQRHRPRGRQEPRVGQDRSGRLDDHPAAGPRALHPRPQARLQAQDPRGQAGLRARGEALQALDPPPVPQLDPLRDGGRAHGDRRPRRRRDLLRQGRQGPDPPGGGAARRAAPGALAVQPVPQPGDRARSAATRCCARWSTTATSPGAEAREAAQRRSG